MNRLSIDTSTLPEYSFQGNTTTNQHGTTPHQESVCLNNSRPSKKRRSGTHDSFDSQQVRHKLHNQILIEKALLHGKYINNKRIIM